MRLFVFFFLTLLRVDFLTCPAEASGLIIMRHGEAEHNVLHTFNADPTSSNYREVHLTDKGILQVKDAALKLSSTGLRDQNVRAIYASPLPRTRETAQLVMKSLSISANKLTNTKSIIENRVGTWEGKSENDFDRTYSHGNRTHAHDYGGETDEDVMARVSALLNRILDECKKNSNVIIVSHGTPSALMLKYLKHIIPDPGLPTAGYVEIPWDEIYRNFPKKCHPTK